MNYGAIISAASGMMKSSGGGGGMFGGKGASKGGDSSVKAPEVENSMPGALQTRKERNWKISGS